MLMLLKKESLGGLMMCWHFRIWQSQPGKRVKFNWVTWGRTVMLLTRPAPDKDFCHGFKDQGRRIWWVIKVGIYFKSICCHHAGWETRIWMIVYRCFCGKHWRLAVLQTEAYQLLIHLKSAKISDLSLLLQWPYCEPVIDIWSVPHHCMKGMYHCISGNYSLKKVH